MELTRCGCSLMSTLDRDGPKSEPPLNVLAHLAISIVLLAVPLFLSTEIQETAESRHFGFFAEPGFWAQEIVVSLCGLANLAAWWQLVSVSDKWLTNESDTLNGFPILLQCLALPRAFSVVALKDFLLPYAVHFLLGNPLPPFSANRHLHNHLQTAFSARQQWAALTLYGVWKLVELWPSTLVGIRSKLG